MSIKISNYMNKEVITIDPFFSVMKADVIMSEYKIGGLPVVEGDNLVGIITSQDIRRTHPNRLVIDAMNNKPYCIKGEATIFDAVNIIEKHKIERLPVLSQDNKLIGIITKGDIYKELGRHFDALTNLVSSELFMNKIVDASQKMQKDLAVLFLDLDNFGELNKKYGHIVGDKVLKEVSELLKVVIKEENLCRYGGDEFAVIIFSDLNDAKILAEKIIESISKNKFLDEISVSISIGIAGGRRKQVDLARKVLVKDVKNLINLASLASTKAKRIGSRYSIADTLELID